MKYLDDYRSAALLDAAPDAMICVTADGRIALVNAQAERLFGYRRAEMVGQQVEILVPDAARAMHPRRRAGYVADPRPRPMGAGIELAGRRRDGSTFRAEISLAAVGTDEGILITVAVRDVTERLAAQEEREQLRFLAERDRLEGKLEQVQRLASLGQLVGGVAHDFNNLLAVILSYASFVREEVANQTPPERWQPVLDDIDQIELAAQRAADLTHQLQVFARREVVQPQVLNLNDVAADLKQLLIRSLGEHIELIIVPDAGLSPVLADRGQLERVLVNLAVNARDAMLDGGRLTIATADTRVDEAAAASHVGLQPGRYVSLKVSDTGAGIPREIIDRLFEPFFTTKPEGSGLGLATVYGIVKQAGGNVRIYSEPGCGTTVTVLLPAADNPAEPPPQVSAGGAGEVVLVVEDEAAMREMIRRILERNGYRMLAAASGREAIDIVVNRSRQIDVLLTDVVMPQMPGNEVAERIRALQPGVRVLFMSGYAQGLIDTQGVLESGVNFIEKPFSKLSLLAKLRDVLAAPT